MTKYFSLALFLLATQSPARAQDAADWRDTFFNAKRNVIVMVERTAIEYFGSQASPAEKEEISSALLQYRAALLAFSTEATLIYQTQANANDECVEIPDLSKKEFRVATPGCRELGQERFERQITRELFAKIAHFSDEKSRVAAAALCEGWRASRSLIPPFFLEGNYTFTKNGSSEVITASIQKANDGTYTISVSTLRNWNGEALSFAPLRRASRHYWTALATNPSHHSRRWTFDGGYSLTRTAEGEEEIALTFTSPNDVRLDFNNKVRQFEWWNEIYERDVTSGTPLIWVKYQDNFTYSGRKN